MAKTKETSEKDPLEVPLTKEAQEAVPSSTFNDLKIELVPSSMGQKFKWKKDGR